ncbi:ABC transporter ATP-binding protein [Enterococcus malodoratus]|uniref:ABC-type quaternary amine transporter n=1 Tax=Enterococcus malodoratus ATCC 43197 TaxID=1158601 RepID=R2PDG0_9ENTE|nr:ABC transporter ATP-binding protein [Enterococcus malodoratus]EOH81283.1 hypothetical protein UAI_00393 [Enterococcus malodoratus ATCC 43197]EOT68866.1 hypothetical protein I585_00325 [Enterococcus malodoratus ATCC 43197]SPW86441.1 ABC transporter family protein [Enterococcus malodoratus]STC71777.1 ABC transporter family protein [Enterococcus malodoratus]
MGLSVKNLQLHYGKNKILKDLSFDIGEREIVALFGPSGVGKTSLLKIIGGIQPIDKGTITFTEGFSQAGTILVFQDFCLFPHMTVVENITFGLKARKFSKTVITQKVSKILEVFDLVGLEKHFPDQLSGGQKQRVALARAIILEPKLLLLDEPFANLDSHLKDSMREYLLRLQKEYSFSVILVTHDREEAFQLADRMIILLNGEIQQIGGPKEIYFYPANQKVAEAVGESNFIPGIVENNCFRIADTELMIQNPKRLQGEVLLFIPYGAEAEICETGLPALIEGIEWSPNGQRAYVKIVETHCKLTNLSQKIVNQEQLFLQFKEPLQVMSR